MNDLTKKTISTFFTPLVKTYGVAALLGLSLIFEVRSDD